MRRVVAGREILGVSSDRAESTQVPQEVAVQ
jgi:hypothetical protein